MYVYVCVCMLGMSTSAVRERVGVRGGLHRSRARAQVDEEADEDGYDLDGAGR